ncbi:MAG: hypothetical protein ACKVOE_00245 [Rickettsiales bacterium]
MSNVTDEPVKQSRDEAIKSLVARDMLRFTRSGNGGGALSEIFVTEDGAQTLSECGLTAKKLTLEGKHPREQFEIGSFDYLVTDTMGRVSGYAAREKKDESRGWTMEALQGANHLPLSEKGKVWAAYTTPDATRFTRPFDAAVDVGGAAMGPGGYTY